MSKQKQTPKNKLAKNETPKGLRDLNLKLDANGGQTNKAYLIDLLVNVDALLKTGDEILNVTSQIYKDISVEKINKIAPIFNTLEKDIKTFTDRSTKLRVKIDGLIEDDIISGIDLIDEVRTLMAESKAVITPNISELNTLIAE